MFQHGWEASYKASLLYKEIQTIYGCQEGKNQSFPHSLIDYLISDGQCKTNFCVCMCVYGRKKEEIINLRGMEKAANVRRWNKVKVEKNTNTVLMY